MPIKLFISNKLEILAKKLAEILSQKPQSPFSPEIILVQSRGMQRWVSMELATHLGICANCRFPFPNAFLEEIFHKIIPQFSDHSFFTPETLAWKIMAVLPSMLELAEFEELKNYLKISPRPSFQPLVSKEGSLCESDSETPTTELHLESWEEDSETARSSILSHRSADLKLAQLAVRIAETFDQYIVYRPEMIFRWESGEDRHWQARLWREITKGVECKHRAAMARLALRVLETASPGSFDLPRRVSIFGISYLPPFHLKIFGALSRFLEVDLFIMNPCQEYWGDIVSPKEKERLSSRLNDIDVLEDELYLDEGNRLLAVFGKQGRDFLELIMEFDCEEFPLFQDPGEETLLKAIQSDILHLTNRDRDAGSPISVDPNDVSIQIHSCHSPMRELEVLYDHLLDMFERFPDLLPKDILVMAPDIEKYAPYIHAVFGATHDEDIKIPFTVSDRGVNSESMDVRSFFTILELADARLTAPQVMDLLSSENIRSRFQLSESDLELILKWVRDVEIRWGMDQESRREWCHYAFLENTWQSGIERLLLGYAMPGRNEKLFQGVLPYDYIEGSDAEILGRFLNFVHQLFNTIQVLRTAKTLGQWSQTLLEVLHVFFAPKDSDEAFRSLVRALRKLGTIEAESGYCQALELSVIRWYLRKTLEREGVRGGYLAGGITFCSLLPMRSIPFRVICLLGMDVNSYPRQSKTLEFDLMAQQPRPGDPSAREDDLYLFLEALISARDVLYLSYTGQSCQDNSTIPPSVLISELMETIDRGFRLPSGKSADCLLTVHRLQPFSPYYFRSQPRLFSYSREHALEAERLVQRKRELPQFFAAPLSLPENEWRRLSFEDLCRFFSNPARFLLNRRLGVYLDDTALVLEETESFELDPLKRFRVQQDMLEMQMSGMDLRNFGAVLRASGQLPHGVAGEYHLQKMKAGVTEFFHKTVPLFSGEQLDPLDFELEIGEFTISGRLDSLLDNHLIRYRYGNLRAKDYLHTWLCHLVLNLCAPRGYPAVSKLVGLEDKKWHAVTFEPVSEPGSILHELLSLYWEGLSTPLRLFPESSLSYVDMVCRKKKSPQEALSKVKPLWEGNDYRKGEGEDPYYRLVFRSEAPLDADFEKISLMVFQPILEMAKHTSGD